MKSETGTVHRSGPFKQQNKSHKTGRHRSKGRIDQEQRGRTDAKSITKRSRRALSKLDRKNRANQLRASKREETLSLKRRLGEANSPPFLVSIVSLYEEYSSESALRSLLLCDEEAVVTSGDRNVTFLSLPRFKQRFSFVTPDPDDLYAVLDCLKVSDTVLFLWPPDGELTRNRQIVLTCCLAQGLPACLNLTHGLSQLNGKKKETCRRQLTKNLEKWALESKFYSYSSNSESLVILRQIGGGAKKSLNLQRYRPHLLVENCVVDTAESNENDCTWKLYGYLRGPPLPVNSLIYIPGFGDFQMKQIDLVPDPHRLEIGRKNANEMDVETKVLEVADPKLRESLITEATTDPMNNEQTWPTEEELKEADDALKGASMKKVPKGTSSYQAAWIVEDDEPEKKDNNEQQSDESDDMEDDVEEPADDQSTTSDEEKEDDDTETIPMSESENTDRYDAAMNVDEEKRLLEQFRKERENELFPDEIDTPLDLQARIRFQKYRGLKSFRTSPWDSNENLPSDYARIFQFENFQRAKKRILNEERDGAMHGWYVCIHVENVPKNLIEKLSPSTPLVVYGQLPHEQKISLINCVVRKHELCNFSVKSKDKLIFHVGYKRFIANPIFSQHTIGDKHKYERFLPSNASVVASLFAPITYPPAPVLVFKMDAKGRHRLVATGGVMDANPSRIIVKRIVLSGVPFKIQKRSAVIRYMFFNREDITWFKPVELRTKYGRRGHIKEPLGTHGHMKCQFDKPITSQDTILMDLYKRVFPKWTYEGTIDRPAPVCGVESAAESEMEVNE